MCLCIQAQGSSAKTAAAASTLGKKVTPFAQHTLAAVIAHGCTLLIAHEY